MILGKIVPQSEVFLKSTNSDATAKKQLHIKRFDPKNPNTQYLLVILYHSYSYSKLKLRKLKMNRKDKKENFKSLENKSLSKK